jgi:acyl carrier protein
MLSPEDVATHVTKIWESVLEIQVNDDDDFFTSGGDSLMVVRVSARLGTELDLRLRPAVLFDNPKKADYIKAVIMLMQEESSDSREAI